MSRVSVHFVFPVKFPPYLQNHAEPLTCDLPDSAKLSTFRLNKELMFPINICRNIARNYSQTKFVMVSDIQLIPSKELASKFITMIRSNNAMKPHYPSRVFVVPVFEIEVYDIIPKTKDELLMMVRNEKAVYFHRYICSHCQKFPGIKTWLESSSTNLNIKVTFSINRNTYIFYYKILAICFGKTRISISSMGTGLYWKQARSFIQ